MELSRLHSCLPILHTADSPIYWPPKSNKNKNYLANKIALMKPNKIVHVLHDNYGTLDWNVKTVVSAFDCGWIWKESRAKVNKKEQREGQESGLRRDNVSVCGDYGWGWARLWREERSRSDGSAGTPGRVVTRLIWQCKLATAVWLAVRNNTTS